MDSKEVIEEFHETFGERLRAERKRLGFSQTELADLGGVRKQAQMNYEAGHRSPQAEYLHRIGQAGINVIYVLTGEMTSHELAGTEASLVSCFRAASADTQRAVLSVLGIVRADQGAVPQALKAAAGSVSIGGAVHGQVLSGEIRQGDVTFNVGSPVGSRRKPSK